MTDAQWKTLVQIVKGGTVTPRTAGFIIDSPWLPGWAGISTVEYFNSETAWFEANLKAIQTFPDAIFLPGFWAEYGMCTEPSAFGAKCSWPSHDLPHAHKILTGPSQAAEIEKPDVQTDGLLPFVIERLHRAEPRILEAGHTIRFAVSRGPLNIASFLMGTTEFMMGLYTHTETCEKLLDTITEFTIDWIGLQKEQFPSIDAILLLDDIVGFIGEDDYMKFAHPYLKRIYDAFPVTVKAFHNDAQGKVCAPHLADMGINLFNFAFEHPLSEMRELCGPSVALLGNLAPRDVLAGQSPTEITAETRQMVESMEDAGGILFSCGGGVPQGVSTDQLNAFIQALKK